MLGSTLLRSPASSSGVLLRGHRSDQKRPIVVRCERNYPPFPKVLRPLGRPTLLDTFVDMLPLVEKTKYKLTDYCTTLEGEECCSCWDAYFEIKDLEQKWPAEKLESFLQNVSREGMKPLIRLLHHAARLEKESDDVIQESTKESEKREVEMHMHVPDGLPKTPEEKRGVEMHRHVPDGLPKTPEEIEEENQGLMPESDFTRLIKSLRVYPSWYRERPDVETA